jgi:hypothetical protein
MKNQSLNNRADMFPVNIYKEIVAEVPKTLLEEKVSLGYFGSSCLLRLIEARRKQMDIVHSKKNTLAIENDNYFITSVKSKTNTPATYKVVPYEKHIQQGLDKSVKFRLDNKPYNYPGQGATRLWADLVKADNKHGILDWQGDVLPTALQRGQDSELKDMRNRYFKDYGLYKVRALPFDAFSEWNADVETAAYFCQKGYTGNITVKTDISVYDYDFKSRGVIVTPDTLDEVDFIFNCLDQDSYNFKNVKHSLEGKDFKKFKKDPKIFSETKTATHKYPIVIGLKANENILGYTSTIIDPGYNTDRIAIPYQVGGYDGGKREIGVVKKVEAGIQLGSYLVDSSINKDIDKHSAYLKSLLPLYLLYTWRTSKTNDNPQLKVIPKLYDTSVETDDDILELFNATGLKEEIVNGLERKITKK